ncbi:S26 family signal peptidase, partial [Streptomyces rhizosphaericola]
MSPTLEIGDTVLAHTADGASVGRGDIVVFQDPDWGNAT